MARHFFGFGRWKNPFWFIGPEPGKGPDEPDDNALRVGAPGKTRSVRLRAVPRCDWRAPLASEQTSSAADVATFDAADEAALGEPIDNESLGRYQRESWGKRDGGETCVIELSGTAARSLKKSAEKAFFIEARIDAIRERLRVTKPAMVLVYGATQHEHWAKIAGGPLVPELY